jgi:hypothetical protein
MEGNGESCLTEGVDFVGFAYDLAARRYEEVLAVMGVNVARHQAANRASEASIEPIDQ